MDRETVSRREQLYGLLGDLPERDHKITARKVSEEDRGTYRIERLVLDLNGVEAVPAIFAYPHKADGPTPCVLYNHWHGGQYDLGKEQLVKGSSGVHYPPYAEVLTGMGCSALCIDAWNFGERSGRTESELFKEMLWKGQTLWGMMVYDSLRAIDYLEMRPDVDSTRLATMGMSMGSTMAWWVAALDERIKVCVDICCMTDYQALIESRGLDEHGVYYYVPGLIKHFSTSDINALIAPRPHLSVAGIFDKLTPPSGLDRVDAEVRKAYARHGNPEAWELRRYPTGHLETAEMRADILIFLRRWFCA